ncbi:substrate-binding domain-containing protein [Acidipila sp. EB88]|uniref:substrate-binding domain-containing protein n=1 Tax=Acidipila sp. EB88 TaxID=2305226 RepID=UPI000F5E200C|nr:substrate-binding domain-containing protein [Acidipila sp. EB88]RRA49573.1 hypothetical protein D1Y84_16140 [Acidipila sp. EB88]
MPRTKRCFLCVRGLALLLCCLGCGRHPQPLTIAVVPESAPEQIWLDEHAGTLRAASHHGVRIYWNAPDREGDVQRQISLVEQVGDQKDAGLVLAPAQELALMLPVRRLLDRHMPVVIISSPMTLPPRPNLAYILNDEDQTGAIAARAIGSSLHGKGSIALLGINPFQSGVTLRLRAFEAYLHREYPAIRITDRRVASDSFSSEQTAAEVLAATPRIDAALALDPSSAIGLYQAEQQQPTRHRITIIACGQDASLFALLKSGFIDAYIAQDSYTMGYQAVDAILRMRQGLPVPARVALGPIVITAANMHDPAILARIANIPDEPL